MKADTFGKWLSMGVFLLLIGVNPIINALNEDYGFASNNEIRQQNTLFLSDSINPPFSFDLRNVNGKNYVTTVKNQNVPGPCWCFATMASMESNLLMTGNWTAAGEYGGPDLSEYHLDWWNGFNQWNNDDNATPQGNGLAVHMGGEYRMASAYLSRGEGAVRDFDAPNTTSYTTPPARYDTSWHIYYPQNIEWYVAGSNLSNINTIKESIMLHGAIASIHCENDQFKADFGTYWAYYQPPYSNITINTHNVAIIGWDDNKITQAPYHGAWLCKNSWGDTWGPEQGYFCISYYDKWCCQQPEQGAVSFQDVEPLIYNQIYYHDYHGWRDTIPNIYEVFNAFNATHDEQLDAVSFFTPINGVSYQVKIYNYFVNGNLQNELATKSGDIPYTGFHTIVLKNPIKFHKGDKFYIYLYLSSGSQPIDRSSYVFALKNSERKYRTTSDLVISSAHPGESYYRQGSTWHDLYNYSFKDPVYNHTANFCIKGLCNFTGPKVICDKSIELVSIKPGSTIIDHFNVSNGGNNGTYLNWNITDWPDWGTWKFEPSNGSRLPGGAKVMVTVTITIPNKNNYLFTGAVKVVDTDNIKDYDTVPVEIFTPFNMILQSHQFVYKKLQFYSYHQNQSFSTRLLSLLGNEKYTT